MERVAQDVTVLFSIVTPTLNRAAMLADALASVRNQDYDNNNIEHIVVDGGSTDGTLALLKQHPNVIVLRDNDQGLYSAMNLGIRRARGEVIGFLNSDDIYTSDAVRLAAAAMTVAPSVDVVCGGAELTQDGMTIASYAHPRNLQLDVWCALIGASIFNARFFRRQLFGRIGPLSEEYRLVSDREFIVRALCSHVRSQPINRVIYTYRKHDGSKTYSGSPESQTLLRSELAKLARMVAGSLAMDPLLRRTAHALEGRCLLGEAVAEMARGDFMACLRTLSQKDGRLDYGTMSAVGIGLVDRIVRGPMGTNGRDFAELASHSLMRQPTA